MAVVLAGMLLAGCASSGSSTAGSTREKSAEMSYSEKIAQKDFDPAEVTTKDLPQMLALSTALERHESRQVSVQMDAEAAIWYADADGVYVRIDSQNEAGKTLEEHLVLENGVYVSSQTVGAPDPAVSEYLVDARKENDDLLYAFPGAEQILAGKLISAKKQEGEVLYTVKTTLEGQVDMTGEPLDESDYHQFVIHVDEQGDLLSIDYTFYKNGEKSDLYSAKVTFSYDEKEPAGRSDLQAKAKETLGGSLDAQAKKADGLVTVTYEKKKGKSLSATVKSGTVVGALADAGMYSYTDPDGSEGAPSGDVVTEDVHWYLVKDKQSEPIANNPFYSEYSPV